jgi:hypothetical protein
VISGNVAGGETLLSGGVAVLAVPDGVPSERNRVTGNVLRGNDPDIFWDGLGAGNVLRGNAMGE